MDPGFLYKGIISSLYLGGVDISYYISFVIAVIIYAILKKSSALSTISTT